MKLSFALILPLLAGHSLAVEPSLRSRNLQNNGKKAENSKGPPFLADGDMPPGLINNPSKVVGVDFKPGRRPKAQKLPSKANGRSVIRGLNGKTIELDITKAERINMYNPDKFELSEDGTYVTSLETGEVIPLMVFFQNDEKTGDDVIFAVDEDKKPFHIRVKPKNMGKEEKNKGKDKKAQMFQRIHDSDVLVGYYEDDIDLSKLPPLTDPIESPEEKDTPDDLKAVEDETKQNNGNRRRRMQSSSFPLTRYGKTCSTFDYVDVAITTDRTFTNVYGNHQARVQAIFAEAGEIYWLESCVYVYLEHYENTVSNNWYWESYPSYRRYSGCTNSYGALNLLRWEASNWKNSIARDAWHMFTGTGWLDSATVGCASLNVCRSKERGYGVNNMSFSSDLRLQSVLFAHELGHNLGLNHLGSTNGWWMMEPSVNYAKYDMNPNNANYIRNKLLGSTNCGYY